MYFLFIGHQLITGIANLSGGRESQTTNSNGISQAGLQYQPHYLRRSFDLNAYPEFRPRAHSIVVDPETAQGASAYARYRSSLSGNLNITFQPFGQEVSLILKSLLGVYNEFHCRL